MEVSTEINLYDNKLVFHDNILFFEDNILYDFEDRYHNISAYGVEQQLQAFLNLVKMIYETSLPKSVKAENVIIFANIFRILSGRNISSDLACIGANDFHELFAYIISLFGSDNKLVTVPTKDANEWKELPDSSFALVLVNLDIIQGNTVAVLNECFRIAEKNSRILCYASGEFNLDLSEITFAEKADLWQLGLDRYLLSIDVTEKKADARQQEAKERLLEQISQIQSELHDRLQYILSNRPSSEQDEWYARMDEVILLTAKLEIMIAKNFDLLDNQDAKYLTNELKNALLDLKFEAIPGGKHYDFFLETLSECYDRWAEGLY